MKKMSKIILGILFSTLITSLSYGEFTHNREKPFQQKLSIGPINAIYGPSIASLIENAKALLVPAIINSFDDIQFTSVNGYGTPLSADLYFTPRLKPKNVNDITWTEIDLMPNCIYGSIFQKTRDAMYYAKLADKVLFYFDVTSSNGFGKPCSAKLGFIHQ